MDEPEIDSRVVPTEELEAFERWDKMANPEAERSAQIERAFAVQREARRRLKAVRAGEAIGPWKDFEAGLG